MMKVIASYPAKRPRNIQVTYWVFAALISIVTLYELFKFEKIPQYLSSQLMLNVPAELIVALATTAQIFALPFLLGMKVSPLMRFMSILCCIVSGLTISAAALLLFFVR